MENIPERLRDFNNLIHEIKMNYPVWKDGLKRCDDLTQDYLHQLEFESLNAIQRSKIANELVKIRKQRRGFKNNIEISKEIREWYKYNNNPLQQLENNVSKTIQIQSEINKRVYKFKVLDKDDI